MADLPASLQRRERFDLKALYDTSHLLSSSLDQDFVLDSLLFTGMSKLLVSRGAVLLYDPVEGAYRVAAVKGIKDLNRNDLLVIDELPPSSKQVEVPASLAEFRLHLLLPIVFGNHDLGYLALGSKATGGEFTMSELAFIKSLINISSPAVHNSIMVEELKQANLDLAAKIQELDTLFDLSQEFNSTMDRDRLVRLLSLSLMGQLLVRQHLFLLKPIDDDPATQTAPHEGFEVVAAQGVDTDLLTDSLRKRLCSIDGIQLLDDPLSDESKTWADLRELGIVLILPLNQQKRLCGVLCLGPKMTGQPYQPDDVEFLQSLGNLALVSIRNTYLMEEQVEKRRMENEMLIARDIQKRLLPQSIPSLAELDIAAEAQPSRLVGGDYFEVRELDGNRVLAAVADVSGKGMPAALLMANVQACLHVLFPMEMSLDEAVGRINRVICENTDPDRFITFFAGIFDISNRTLRYVNAGHNPPYLVRAEGCVETLETGGLLLGVFSGAPYEVGTVELGPQDVVVLFTDGVTESLNPDQEEFGEDRLVECLIRNRGRSSREILEAIRTEVERFTGPRLSLDDDLTMVVVKSL